MSINSGASFGSQSFHHDSLAARKSRKSSGARRRFITYGSVAIEKQPSLRFEPTFRLDSYSPFNPEFVQLMLRFDLERNFEGYTYSPKGADKKCQRTAINLLTRVKKMNYDRYRLACVVVIGEKYYQDCKFVSGFLWDKTKDLWAYHIHETPNFYAIAIVYGVYFD